jgi:hypothetical protein
MGTMKTGSFPSAEGIGQAGPGGVAIRRILRSGSRELGGRVVQSGGVAKRNRPVQARQEAAMRMTMMIRVYLAQGLPGKIGKQMIM